MFCSVLYKQAAYGFYRPGALGLANLLSDLPFSATRVLIFDIIIYFMCGLSRSAGGFFVYHLFQYCSFLAMQVCFLNPYIPSTIFTVLTISSRHFSDCSVLY